MAILFAAGTESIRTSASFAELSTATVMYWVRFATLPSNSRIVGTDTNWESRLAGTDLLHEYRQNAVPNSTTVFTTATWYHLAFAFDGTNKAVWVDASPDPALGAYTHNAAGTDTALAVGTSTWSQSQGMNGTLEDLRIYNRVLSTREVQEVFNGNGRDGLINGLQHWWTLNNGAENTVVTLEPDMMNAKINLSTIVGSPIYVKSPREFLGRAA